MAQSVQQTVDKEIISTLKVGNRGWNIQLFEDQIKLRVHICTKCKSVCCDAVELGCDHNDDDIFSFCNDCLKHLVQENDNKCPIDGHIDPVIIPSRSCRRQISKAIVFCPYSEAYKTVRKDNYNNSDNDGVDKILDTKEGVEPQFTKLNIGCVWNGTLNDLINIHIAKCIKNCNPSVLINIKVQKLEHENNELKQENNELRNKIISQKVEIEKFEQESKTHGMIINELEDKIKLNQHENAKLKVQLNAQIKVMQDFMNNMNVDQVKQYDDDDINNYILNQELKQDKETKFEFIIPKENKHKLRKIDKNTVEYVGGFSFSPFWFMFGSMLKGDDEITIQFEIEKKGDKMNYRFGFGTAKFEDYNHRNPRHSSTIWSTSNDTFTSYINDEFAEINDMNEIKKMLQNMCFFITNISVIFISVDMKQKKGWIWTGDNDDNIIEFNLPEEVCILLGFGGNEKKMVNVKSIHIEKHNNNDQVRQIETEQIPMCLCGGNLEIVELRNLNGIINCDACGESIKGIFAKLWHCPLEETVHHKKGYDLCIKCGKEKQEICNAQHDELFASHSQLIDNNNNNNDNDT